MTIRKAGTPVAERLGLILFLGGLAVFVGVGLLDDFAVDDATLAALSASDSIREAHREALYSELRDLEPHEFGSAFSLVPAVDGAITRANGQLQDKIWDYDRSQYTYFIARDSSRGPAAAHPGWFLLLSVGLASLGGLTIFASRARRELPGIKNDGVRTSAVKSRGWIGIGIGGGLILFYVLLYFFPAYIVDWIRLADPLSRLLRGYAADRWFFYGMLYTVTILVMGLRMMVNYRHSRYHLVRTLSVMFFQLGFAFLIPAILASLNRSEVDFKNIWPLDYSFFYSYRLDGLASSGAFGWFVLLWGLGLIVFVVPLMAYFFGKRWYCSWVCGCGGLAETLGDPFRHLSSKTLRSWRIERFSVHGVLVFALVMTAIVLVNYFSGRDGSPLLGEATWRVQKWYGFLIGSIFAGVVGTGFYPLMGNRVWCRFGCPLAAVLGLLQKFKSRFRITVNGGQCISCGNCSTYCEMGIDVRWYSQRGQNVIRASCVGCGVCATVCPRGVLRLENGPTQGRYNETSLLQLGGGSIDAD